MFKFLKRKAFLYLLSHVIKIILCTVYYRIMMKGLEIRLVICFLKIVKPFYTLFLFVM